MNFPAEATSKKINSSKRTCSFSASNPLSSKKTQFKPNYKHNLKNKTQQPANLNVTVAAHQKSNAVLKNNVRPRIMNPSSKNKKRKMKKRENKRYVKSAKVNHQH